MHCSALQVFAGLVSAPNSAIFRRFKLLTLMSLWEGVIVVTGLQALVWEVHLSLSLRGRNLKQHDLHSLRLASLPQSRSGWRNGP
jgi:hypothetical protein